MWRKSEIKHKGKQHQMVSERRSVREFNEKTFQIFLYFQA